MPYSIVYVYKTYVPTILLYENLHNIYMCVIKIMLWACQHKILEKLKIKNPGPIVSI